MMRHHAVQIVGLGHGKVSDPMRWSHCTGIVVAVAENDEEPRSSLDEVVLDGLEG